MYKNRISKRVHIRVIATIGAIAGFLLASLPLCTLAYPAGGGFIDLKEVKVPEEYGVIKDFFQAPEDGSDPLAIFHIQDVHVNYEAQKNLANLLEFLIETYGLSLILVEGGITDKDFSYIRKWATLEERKVKAEELLKEGVISGETYVDIATDFPLKFQGIEDKELYEKNMEAYLEVESFRADALNVINGFSNLVEQLKKFIYTSRLKKFDQYKSSYIAEDTELVEYLELLNEVAAKEKIPLDQYLNYNILLYTARLEKKINFDRVERDRDNIIKKLSDKLPKKDFDELLIKSLSFKEGEISSGVFYSYLHRLSKDNGLKMNRYKNFNRYIEYIVNYEKLKRPDLFKEIIAIEGDITDQLCKNDEQKTLFQIAKNISILKNFLMLKLSPENLEYYRSQKGSFVLSEWRSFLNKHAARFHINGEAPQDISAIENNFPVLESFYDVAFKRDEAFLRNSVAKMKREKERIAVLIAGGFHTKNLMNAFMAENISYIVITPKFRQKTDDLLYDRVLKESYDTRIWNE